MNLPDKTPNPILATALAMMEGIAPGGLDDPEKALRDLVPRLRFLVVERVFLGDLAEQAMIPQLVREGLSVSLRVDGGREVSAFRMC